MATVQRYDQANASQKSNANSAELLDRLPPQNLDAEKDVLGSLLLLPDLCDEVALILKPDDFYSKAHGAIFAAMLALHEEGKRVDATLLVERLKDDRELEEIGGKSYIAELVHAVPTAANAEYYARIVSDKATLRALIHGTTEVLRDAYDATREPRELVSQAEQRIFSIHDKRWGGEVHNIHDVMQEAFVRIDARLQGEDLGVPTGFGDFDSLTGGLHDGELLILAARPSMGKTALALNIAENVAADAGVCTLVVSLEMSRLELAQRMLCSCGRISGSKFRSGFLTGDDRQALVEASAKLSQAPLFIDDSPGRTVTEIAAAARRLKRRKNLGLIIIDYLQLLEPDNPADPRQEQVAKMARRLKNVAREVNVPVLCLAQLNRQAELSRDNRPRMSHLRESGAIEQDADVVMFVHREEYYLSREQREDENDPRVQSVKGSGEIIVAKQRNGPVGDIPLLWFQEFTRFETARTEQQSHYSEFESFGE